VVTIPSEGQCTRVSSNVSICRGTITQRGVLWKLWEAEMKWERATHLVSVADNIGRARVSMSLGDKLVPGQRRR